MNIVLAHLGGKWRAEVFELCQEYPNCFTDCSALQGWLPSDPDTAIGRLRELAKRIPDKVSFGSDFPLFDLSYESPQWVRFVREQPWADEDTKAKLLGGNMRKVLGI
jgi:predicted TIM-barrel fold metal-dependent hydrolase